MVSTDDLLESAMGVVLDEVKGVVEPAIDLMMESGGLDFLVDMGPEAVLEGLIELGGNAANNFIVEMIRLAIQEAVHKVMVKNFGEPPALKKENEREVAIVQDIFLRVLDNLIQPANMAAGSAIGAAITANPALAFLTPLSVALGRLAGLCATAFEESMFMELMLYQPRFIELLGGYLAQLKDYAVDDINQGVIDPTIGSEIHVPGIEDQVGENVDDDIGNALNTMFAGWTPEEIRIYKESGYTQTADMQRQSQALVQATVGKVQSVVINSRAPTARTNPLLSGLRDSPFTGWTPQQWSDPEDHYRQDHYRNQRQEEGDYTDILNGNLY